MSEEQKLPEIPDLTIEKAHRLICADYLRQIATLVEKGGVEAFDFAWNTEIRKPVGKMVCSSTFILGPVEAQFLRNAAAVQAEQEQVIPVTDMTEEFQEEFKDHEPCEGEDKNDCPLCCTTLS